MNLLVDPLPEYVEINGVACKINSDFASGIRTVMAFEDHSLTDIEKQMVLLENLYPVIPEDVEKAVLQAIRFLNCGRDLDSDKAGGIRVYSFSHDAGLIFSAFKQTHGVDLSTARLHWWVFMSLFMDLGSETFFCHLVNLRHRVKTGKATKEERVAALDMAEIFDIPEPDIRSIEQIRQEQEFLSLVAKGRQ